MADPVDRAGCGLVLALLIVVWLFIVEVVRAIFPG